jgi:hypothetical protein
MATISECPRLNESNFTRQMSTDRDQWPKAKKNEMPQVTKLKGGILSKIPLLSTNFFTLT